MDVDPVSFLISTVLLFFTWWLWYKNRNLPPGPRGWPFLGYYPYLKTTHEDFWRLSRIYGDVISFRTLGGTLIVVLNRARVIKEVLINRADEFDGRPLQDNLISWVSDGLGISQEEGDIWSEHRKFFVQTAKSFGLGKQEIEERIQDEIRQMLSEFRKAGSKPGDVHFNVAYAANSVISHILFSKKLDRNKTFRDILTVMIKLVFIFVGNIHMVVGYPFLLLMKMHPELKKFVHEKDDIRKWCDGIAEEQVLTFDPSRLRGYVDAYLLHMSELREKGKLESSSFTKERLLANTVNLFFEGTETTSFTITSLLLELAKHLDVQKEAQKELDTVVGRERLPSWTDRSQLPYVDATIQELYRVAAQIVVTTMYSNFKETTIDGYRIPRRSIIVANLWSIHYDPENYPNPEIFDPKRFLDEEGKRIKREGPYPFGLGKRSCVGEALAQMEVFLIISSILQNFTVHPIKEEEYDLRLTPRE